MNQPGGSRVRVHGEIPEGAACGGDEDEASDTPSNAAGRSASRAVDDAHNAQDVQFAQGMIPHHRQAVDMADLAPGAVARAARRRRRGDVTVPGRPRSAT
ncbi:hypothetical protein AQ490_22305 [Wenjunlia vitaminophila]|uniref:DUF305 domain-containing protein n=1 Tax=Wenjunlia vitaminophila TaxID=76728 RepID=A0A0T6LSM3_WENVI|nr:hypothetical protein AQ490_22305 [Wenjunlia vitaminophila]